MLSSCGSCDTLALWTSQAGKPRGSCISQRASMTRRRDATGGHSRLWKEISCLAMANKIISPRHQHPRDRLFRHFETWVLRYWPTLSKRPCNTFLMPTIALSEEVQRFSLQLLLWPLRRHVVALMVRTMSRVSWQHRRYFSVAETALHVLWQSSQIL